MTVSEQSNPEKSSNFSGSIFSIACNENCKHFSLAASPWRKKQEFARDFDRHREEAWGD